MALILDRSNILSHAEVFDWMYRTRAMVFRDRCGWDVEVIDGWEIDRSDREEDPLYIIVQDDAGHLVGSLRLIPTTGDTMLSNEFAYMFDEEIRVRSPLIYECTRFCVAPSSDGATADAARRASSDLLIALCSYCLENGIEQIQGLYGAAMTKIYRRIGWAPVEIARARPEAGDLRVGLWDVTPEALANLRQVASKFDRQSDRAA